MVSLEQAHRLLSVPTSPSLTTSSRRERQMVSCKPAVLQIRGFCGSKFQIQYCRNAPFQICGFIAPRLARTQIATGEETMETSPASSNELTDYSIDLALIWKSGLMSMGQYGSGGQYSTT